jgi:membrane protein implicated in regulation of membrane protease activity
MAEIKTGTVLLAGLAGLAALASTPEVQSVVSLIPPPWGMVLSAGLSLAAIVKRVWFPSTPTEGTLTKKSAADSEFISMMAKVIMAAPNKPADIVCNDSGLRISSDVPDGQPGQIG